MKVIGPANVNILRVGISNVPRMYALYQMYSYTAAITIWRQCETLRLPPVNLPHTESALHL
jgi:hypothetical protein